MSINFESLQYFRKMRLWDPDKSSRTPNIYFGDFENVSTRLEFEKKKRISITSVQPYKDNYNQTPENINNIQFSLVIANSDINQYLISQSKFVTKLFTCLYILFFNSFYLNTLLPQSAAWLLRI